MQIETIVLSHDARGISKLKDYLPADSYTEGAQFLLDEIRDNDGPVIITTGKSARSLCTWSTNSSPAICGMVKSEISKSYFSGCFFNLSSRL